MTGLVYLASYPRSGNTLLRMILAQRFGLRTVSAYDESIRIATCPNWASWLRTVAHWDQPLLTQINAEQGIVPYKTHDHPLDTPDRNAPAIYVVRDGREVCTSYWRYHHQVLNKLHVSLADVIRGHCQFGNWSAHLAAWQPQRRPNTLMLFYEDMVKRPAVVVGQLARFLDRVPTGHMPVAWEQVHQADPVFFRSGTNETWRELLTGDDMSLFWDLHGETMREYGYSEEACYANS